MEPSRKIDATLGGYTNTDGDRKSLVESFEDTLRPDSFTLPTGRILRGKELEEFLLWRKNNPYYGKHFSILGDSVSTLEGYNPTGFNLFFKGIVCEISGVREMKDAWWGQVIDFFGGELLVNNSWSGSRVSRLPDSDELFPSGCSDERCAGLHVGDVMPDCIIVEMGGNDWGHGGQLMLKPKQKDPELAFDYAYDMMLSKLHKNYPKAEIICCPNGISYMEKNPNFHFPYGLYGTHTERFNDVIRAAAARHNCRLADIYKNHLPHDTVDGAHPTAQGMRTISTQTCRILAGQEGEKFLNCPGEHEYISAEATPDTTVYICRRCAARMVVPLRQPPESLFPTECLSLEERRFGNVPMDKTSAFYDRVLRFELDGTYRELSNEENTIRVGRMPGENDLCPEGRKVSRHHAVFCYLCGQWWLEDAGSKNGTYINGERILTGTKYMVLPEDKIAFADKSIVLKKAGKNC